MFALGTAQLGQEYGLTNRTGPPDAEEVLSLISTAAEHGVLTFDTAQAYGDSERALGRALHTLGLGEQVRIISKLSLTADTTAEDFFQGIRSSLDRLRVPQLHGLLIHNDDAYPEQILPHAGTLEKAVAKGLIGGWGLSTYEPAKARHLLAETSGSLLQVPANVLDRRFPRAGIAELGRETGKRVYLRSVFLQGLLLQTPGTLPGNGPAVRPALTALHDFCREHDLDPASFVYRYVRDSGWGTPVLGAETTAQLEANLARDREAPLAEELRRAWDARWPDDHLSLIDPRYWPST